MNTMDLLTAPVEDLTMPALLVRGQVILTIGLIAIVGLLVLCLIVLCVRRIK